MQIAPPPQPYFLIPSSSLSPPNTLPELPLTPATHSTQYTMFHVPNSPDKAMIETQGEQNNIESENKIYYDLNAMFF